MKKLFVKIQALIMITVLCLCNTSGISAYAASAQLPEENITVYTDVTANVFFDDELPRFRIKIQNPTSSVVNVPIEAKVVDRNGQTVWTQSKNITLKANGTSVTGIGITDKQLPYGNYVLKVDVGGFSNSVSREIEFAVAVENTELNTWASTNFHLGDDPEYEDLNKNLELAKKAGFARNRDDIRWHRSEDVIGSPKLPEWRKNIVDTIRYSGQEAPIYILGILHFTYTGGLCPHEYDETICANHRYCKGNTYTFEQQVEAYARFCAYVATELKGTKPIFELGNEVELDRAYPGSVRYFNFTGQQYAELVKAGYTAIKNVDKEATVITAGTCALANDNSQGIVKELLSVEGITKYMDGFAFHPYACVDNYTDEISASEAAFYSQIDFAKQQLDAAMKRDGTSGITLWATEFGSKTEDDNKQAAIDVRSMVMSRSEPTMRSMSIYNFVSKGTDLTAGENRFGIVRKNYTAVKPAYVALSNMNKRLAGAEYKDGLFERAYSGDRKFSAYGFKRESELTKQHTYVLWEHTGKESTLTINKNGAADSAAVINAAYSWSDPTITVAENADVKVYDMLGNELSQADTYALSNEPLYVVATVSEETTKISKTGNLVQVKGKADKPGDAVTLMVTKENSLVPAYIFFDEMRADGLGEFEFSFSVPNANDQYSVYVYDGSKVSLAGSDALYTGLKLHYFVNGQQVDDLSSVKDNDVIGIKLTLKGTEPTDNLRFYGSIDSKSGCVVATDCKGMEWNSSDGTSYIELKTNNAADIEKFDIFLWDKDMRPVTPALTIQR